MTICNICREELTGRRGAIDFLCEDCETLCPKNLLARYRKLAYRIMTARKFGGVTEDMLVELVISWRAAVVAVKAYKRG